MTTDDDNDDDDDDDDDLNGPDPGSNVPRDRTSHEGTPHSDIHKIC